MPKSKVKTLKFSEMRTAIKQHKEGVISEAVLAIALQCDDFQMDALKQMSELPANVFSKVCISDWDDDVEFRRELGLQEVQDVIDHLE